MSAPQVFTTLTADELLREAEADEWAWISSSVYECGRVVSDAPWLDGHAERLRFVLTEQAGDGGWGLPGFRLVTSLSATEALLTAYHRWAAVDRVVPRAELRRAAASALVSLRRTLAEATGPLPDLVAIELLVPRLVEVINERLRRLAEEGDSFGDEPLRVPAHTLSSALAQLRGATAAGRPVPPKLWYSWEIVGSGRPQDPAVAPVAGSVGCSPAATVAWLGARPPAGHRSLRYLDAVQRRTGGLFPIGAPMPHFERSWILNLFHTHGVPHQASPAMLDGLEAALGPDGAPGGDGLPVDADDTAAVLYALDAHGRDPDVTILLRYFDGDKFFTYPEERTSSPTTNAHALDALGHWTSRRPAQSRKYAPVLHKTRDWLIGAQNADGSWADKWHGSPFYATATCVQALAGYGGSAARPAVERAVAWVLDQRQGDRWGLGGGTVEETAYAAWILHLSAASERPELVDSLAAARRGIREGIADRPPAMWFAKDVYAPVRIIRATCLAVAHRLRRTRS
ncbi:prenyltransferase/squalene oxidase repeat-containing protein [Actinoplanes sp. NPDC049265]|uniref:prenyltransferase/squalene oxidase repeat-containing protein n=1 Tax=Actinoplanes sp. NPDC049265 TaxID=3363902 RepID=UPI0037140ACB